MCTPCYVLLCFSVRNKAVTQIYRQIEEEKICMLSLFTPILYSGQHGFSIHFFLYGKTASNEKRIAVIINQLINLLCSTRTRRHDRGDLQQGEERNLVPERPNDLGALEGISMTSREYHVDAATKYARPASFAIRLPPLTVTPK